MRLEEISFPPGSDDETELLLQWLNYLRGAVLRNIEGLDDAQARWTPNGKLIPLLGIVNHLAKVEWRWIEGGFSSADVSRTEQEFTPGQDLCARSLKPAFCNHGNPRSAINETRVLYAAEPALS